MIQFSRSLRALSTSPFFIFIISLLLFSTEGCSRANGTTSPEVINLLQQAYSDYSIDGGETYSLQPPVIGAGSTVRVLIRSTFTYDRQASSISAGTNPYAVLELTHSIDDTPESMSFSLNNEVIGVPFEEMFYRTIPAIDAQILQNGENVLTGDILFDNSSGDKNLRPAPEMKLVPLRNSDLRFQTGPILGAFDRDFFTLVCRTNMPAQVSVIPTGAEATVALIRSEMGLIHRFRVPRSTAGEPESYIVVAERDGFSFSANVNPVFQSGDLLKFAVLADCRTHPDKWHLVADMVAASDAELVLHTGDMVTRGLNDWEWDEQFWAPAAALLASKPLYAVIGNHEQNAPLYDELIYAPSEGGRARNWFQHVKGVLLIGIDGDQDWSSGSENARWLEEILRQAEAKFILLATHYPSWSSSNHGRLNDRGVPRERPVRQGRNVIMPLLEKYNATAMLAGHDHVYERSEPPGGVTVIISGGAGAPLYDTSREAEKQNPHSKFFASVLHYCFYEVDGDVCTMQAITLDGEIIDTKTWRARGTG